MFFLRVAPVYNPQPSEELGGRDVPGDRAAAGVRARGEERRVAGASSARVVVVKLSATAEPSGRRPPPRLMSALRASETR